VGRFRIGLFATHAGIRTPPRSTGHYQPASAPRGTLPYHPQTHRLPGAACESTASVEGLSPATLSAQQHSTSELLRTLSRMAASKPTSWLSLHRNIL
jgi:hypothetical protein